MKITYRIANLNDLEELYGLAISFSEYNTQISGIRERFFWPGWEEGFREEILECLNDEESQYFVAVESSPENEKIVGYILGRKFIKEWYYSIEELFVCPDYRGKAVGKELLKMAIKQGISYSLPIRVEIYTWNEEAKKFYLKRGFKEDSVILEYPDGHEIS